MVGLIFFKIDEFIVDMPSDQLLSDALEGDISFYSSSRKAVLASYRFTVMNLGASILSKILSHLCMDILPEYSPCINIQNAFIFILKQRSSDCRALSFNSA